MNITSKIAICAVIVLATFVVPDGVRGETSTAPQNKVATAEVPFDFFTLDAKCPAGSYSVAAIGGTHYFIRNTKELVADQVFTIPDPAFSIDGTTPRLVFVERGGKNYLVGIMDSNGFQRISGLFGVDRKDGDVRKEIALKYQ